MGYEVWVQRVSEGQYKVIKLIGSTQILKVSPTKPAINVGDTLNETQMKDLRKSDYVVTTDPYA